MRRTNLFTYRYIGYFILEWVQDFGHCVLFWVLERAQIRCKLFEVAEK
jgi:hypothetical protein